MLIEITDVTHRYGDRTVLDSVSVSFDQPRVGVIGANGSGKSTLARLLNALVLPSRGQVLVGGLDTRRAARAVRRRVGFCFTDPDAQIVMPTVAEDVAFGLRPRRLAKTEVAAKVAAVLSAYGLAEHADHPAHLLSGGQKQLLALAAVLVTEPELVVLDEPTTLLDLRNAGRIAELIAGLGQQVVLVTHQLDQVRDFDRVLVVDEGRLVADGEPAETVRHYTGLMARR